MVLPIDSFELKGISEHQSFDEVELILQELTADLCGSKNNDSLKEIVKGRLDELRLSVDVQLKDIRFERNKLIYEFNTT